MTSAEQETAGALSGARKPAGDISAGGMSAGGMSAGGMSAGGISVEDRTVGSYWSAHARPSGNWWTNEMVVRDINRRVNGMAHTEVSRSAHELGRDLAPRCMTGRGVSVGCGIGAKEIALLEGGFDGHMIAYDLAESRIGRARARAARHGLEMDRIEFHVADAFMRHDAPEFDLVYWNNSLHHMFDVPAALVWSRDILRRGGLLLVDEFVGPSRMRFDDETLAYANAIRALLPERILAPPPSGVPVQRVLSREWFAHLITRDPSEAADSGRTLDALRGNFADAVIRPTGGVVYFIALNGLFGNFDMDAPEDHALLAHLLKLDAIYTDAHPDRTIYAVAAAIR